MSNNKIRIISLLFPIPFFIFSTLSLFIIDYNVISKNYNDSVNGVNYNMVYNSKNIDSEIQNRLDRTLSNSRILDSGIPTIRESINAVYALIDSEGNVIAKSAPCILISCYDDDTEEKTGYSGKIIDLEPYFTDEISSRIADFPYSVVLQVDSVSVHKEDDNLIPVEVTFSNYMANETLTIRFTDYEPDFTMTGDDYELEAYSLRNFDDSVQRKEYIKLRDNLNNYIADFTKTHDAAKIKELIESPLDYKDSNHRKIETGLTCHDENGEPIDCVFYMELEQDPIHYTLNSWDFRDSFKAFSCFFSVVGLLSFVITNYIISKKEKMIKSRNKFISGAASELDAPLSVIDANCQSYFNNPEPEKSTEYVSNIYNECKQMSRTVKKLLQYNRLNGELKANKTNIDFVALVNNAVENYASVIEAKDIDFKAELPDSLIFKCDEKMMEVVLDSFISNAVKFTPENGRVRIKVIEASGLIYFEIFNSGSRVSNKYTADIWKEPGDRKNRGTEETAGMSLAICRVILDNLDMQYGFRNTDNGVKFYFNSNHF